MNTPNIRFKGYTDDWVKRKLEDVVDVCSGKDYKHLEDGDIPVYGTGGYMLSVSEALSEDKDAIGIGRKGTIDNPYILRAPFWTVDTLFYCIPKKDYDLNFVYATYQSIDWKAMDESTGVPSLSKTAINAVTVAAPSKEEQIRIGGHFATLDNLITLQQRKCDDLQEVKKYMLQKLFPQNGAKIPEIRFAGFTGEWEQRKVGDIFRVTRGYVLPANETDENYSDEKPYPVYSSQTKNYGLMGYYGKYLYENAITWTTDGANAGTVNYRPGKFYCTNVCGVLLSDDGYSNKMIAEALNAVAWKHVSFVGNPKLMNNVMSEIKINLPKSIEEQQKIGDYLTNLDNLITLQQRKCDDLKEVKRYMLQNMFPQGK